jgi:putative SOS response-associated peptidase YedK
MPGILAAADWAKWLGEEAATSEELKALLVPCPDEAVKVWLNWKRSDKGPEVLQPESVSVV